MAVCSAFRAIRDLGTANNNPLIQALVVASIVEENDKPLIPKLSAGRAVADLHRKLFQMLGEGGRNMRQSTFHKLREALFTDVVGQGTNVRSFPRRRSIDAPLQALMHEAYRVGTQELRRPGRNP